MGKAVAVMLDLVVAGTAKMAEAVDEAPDDGAAG
jgi:hypothetical protein